MQDFGMTLAVTIFWTFGALVFAGAVYLGYRALDERWKSLDAERRQDDEKKGGEGGE